MKKSNTKAIAELNRSTVYAKTLELKQQGTNRRAFYQNYSRCCETIKRTSNSIDWWYWLWRGNHYRMYAEKTLLVENMVSDFSKKMVKFIPWRIFFLKIRTVFSSNLRYSPDAKKNYENRLQHYMVDQKPLKLLVFFLPLINYVREKKNASFFVDKTQFLTF